MCRFRSLSLQVSVPKGAFLTAKAPPKGSIVAEKGDSRPAGFYSRVVTPVRPLFCFPKETGQKPVYVSVTDVLTPAQVKQRQEESVASRHGTPLIRKRAEKRLTIKRKLS
ncbi:colicin-like bacteriocin tRNase domain-containing protein [Klebsiella pneumoniae]|uniref:colicin-like bacteriocin tRNase domain-containing protein n=1 Tax=Klebsiella pneumoniae TaxID=573 RepID=UPI0022B685A8|nr:colicin-like bacteriocin tRNase domain-containing protein [Klebsiella pneumoniae]